MLCLYLMGANGYVYGVVWRFEARTCRSATKIIRCNTFNISTNRQMHYTRCYQLAFIHFKSISYKFCSASYGGTDTLFAKFWSVRWLVRLGNVCGCEALALVSFYSGLSKYFFIIQPVCGKLSTGLK